MQTEGHKLFVGGLPRDITEDELNAVFPTYGEVLSVHIVASSAERSKTGHCCAFVVYKTKEAAEDAMSVLDGKYRIREGPDVQAINVSWPKPSKGKGDMGGKGQADFTCKGKGCYGGFAAPGYDAGGWGAPAWKGGGGWQQPGWGGAGWDAGGWGCDKGKAQYGGGKGTADYYGCGKGGDWGKGAGGGCGGCNYGNSSDDGKLFVGNLPGDIIEESMRYVFESYGKVHKVHVMAGRSKSGQACAFVEYSSPQEAETAIATLHEKYEIRPGDGPIIVKQFHDRKRSGPY
jgi:hypothetical protein